MVARNRVLRAICFVALVAAFAPLWAAQPTSAKLPLTPVYRFYNQTNGTHFYTASEEEIVDVQTRYSAIYTFEGFAYYAGYDSDSQLESVLSILPQGSGEVPLYRFYNEQNGSHFYTISETEKAFVEANYPEYVYDGIAYSVFTADLGQYFDRLVPVHRFYDRLNGSHFYTASETEKLIVQTRFRSVYRYEGVAFCVLSGSVVVR